MLKLVKNTGNMKIEYLSKSPKIVLIPLVEGTNDLGNVNFPDFGDLAVETS